MSDEITSATPLSRHPITPSPRPPDTPSSPPADIPLPPHSLISSPRHPIADLFLISLLILFLELACIRWFPAHVLFLTFFTNTVLLACFLGMSLGCLAAGHPRNYLNWTPLLLVVGLAAAHAVESARNVVEKHLDVGNQASPQLVFFGTEYKSGDPTRFVIPMEVLAAFFFVAIALALVGPGQQLGRALNHLPNRVLAYTVNIFGSVVGIVLFACFSWLELSPLWWFLPVVLGIAYFLHKRPGSSLVTRWVFLVLILLVASLRSSIIPSSLGEKVQYFWPSLQVGETVQHCWSPYYRIDYQPKDAIISVNLIGHQQMIARDTSHPAYALPYLLNRDSGGQPFENVLIIGAGSGNDVSRALQWGAKHVDAVEIDPVIYRLGKEHHPDKPYADERVTVHLGDGRNFLRSTDKKYDLVIYALVDSLVLHSGYSNIRLESYLFTQQAFEDIRRCLKPNGLFVMYNWFRQGWIVARIFESLQKVFQSEPVVVPLPHIAIIEPDAAAGYVIFMTGNNDHIKSAFQKQPEYWLRDDRLPKPDVPNGFETRPSSEERKTWDHFGQAKVNRPANLGIADDNWPFLYLREPMIPNLSLRGAAIMGGLALVLLLWFLPRRQAGNQGSWSDDIRDIADYWFRRQPDQRGWSFDGRMFFLGAGFMLIETKAVVHMALLFGSTWMVNSVVFFAVLVMILAANLYVLAVRPEKLWLYYAGLFLSLVLNTLIPLDYFLGMDWTMQVVGSCLLVFAPILFAGVIFAVSFGRTTEPDRAFGANIAGAMLGGLAEYSSMLLGFQHLVLVAIVFYALSAVWVSRVRATVPAPEPHPA